MDDLVRELSLTPARVAIELNRDVIRRADWNTTILNDGDRIEIVHFVGGGSEARPSERASFAVEQSEVYIDRRIHM